MACEYLFKNELKGSRRPARKTRCTVYAGLMRNIPLGRILT